MSSARIFAPFNAGWAPPRPPDLVFSYSLSAQVQTYVGQRDLKTSMMSEMGGRWNCQSHIPLPHASNPTLFP